MTEPATITVHGHLGKPKQYTREQYTNEWVSHARDLHNLTITNEDDEAIARIIQTIRAMAGRRWDEIYMKEAS